MDEFFLNDLNRRICHTIICKLYGVLTCYSQSDALMQCFNFAILMLHVFSLWHSG